ncbi:MAG TPA: hypothetical protein VK694_03150 [Verrucomicrobiae bacterium]|nr:hypothetical protein [Verrucomicrobiae bacterium]
MEGQSILNGLIAYEIPIDEEDRTRLEIEVPATGNLSRINTAFKQEVRAYHEALPPEEQEQDPHVAIVRWTPAIVRLGNAAFIGMLWLPQAAEAKGMIVQDGRAIYERRMAEQRQQRRSHNPYKKPDKHYGGFSQGRVTPVEPKEEYL